MINNLLKRVPSFYDNFRILASLGVTATGVVFLLPFVVYHFLQGNMLLFSGSALVVLICTVNVVTTLRGNYLPYIPAFILTPWIIAFLVISMWTQGIIGFIWCYPALISFYFMLPERQAWLANLILLLMAIPLAFHLLETSLAVRVAITLFAVSMFSLIFIRLVLYLKGRLEEEARTDPLTGLFNRASLQESLEEAHAQFNRAGTKMTLLLLDLDDFKGINDTFGHDEGDRVLQRIGALLGRRFRKVDKAFRIGGEEFLVLLFDTGLEQGRMAAQEILREITDSPLLPGRTVTASIGVSTLAASERPKDWLKNADEKLYEAKTGGRNRIAY